MYYLSPYIIGIWLGLLSPFWSVAEINQAQRPVGSNGYFHELYRPAVLGLVK
jgi:hypothetical protein